MRRNFLGSISLLMASASMALADPPTTLPQPNAVPLAISADQLELPKPAAVRAPEASGKPAPPTSITPATPPSASENGDPATTAPCCDKFAHCVGRVKPEDLKDDHCGPSNQWWASADALYWWTKNGPMPVAIVTTGPTGIIGQPGTQILLGDSKLDYGDHFGGRLLVGTWLDDRHIWGFEGGGFLLEEKSASAAVASNTQGAPALTEPFFNTLINRPDAFRIAFPNQFSGTAAIDSFSRLWGTEANVIRNLASGPNFHADLVMGFRYLDLTEDLNIVRTSTALADTPFVLGQPPLLGNFLSLADRFYARNQFFGGQVGGYFEFRDESWSLGLQSKVALGPNHESVNFLGSSTLQTPGGGVNSASGGFQVLPGANEGRRKTDWFTVVPEVGVQVGYQLTCNIRLQVGYDFLYINDVVRPGNQVSGRVNPAFVPSSGIFGSGPGLVDPRPLLRQDDFWAHGVSLGLSISY